MGITINNAIGLLEECLENGNRPSKLYAWFVNEENLIKQTIQELKEIENENNDICGLCGLPGADKIPHPEHWPGEEVPDTELVHATCEDEECRRAHAALSDSERKEFLRSIWINA